MQRTSTWARPAAKRDGAWRHIRSGTNTHQAAYLVFAVVQLLIHIRRLVGHTVTNFFTKEMVPDLRERGANFAWITRVVFTEEARKNQFLDEPTRHFRSGK